MPKTRNHKRKNSRKSRKNRNKKGAGLFTKSPEMKLAEKLDSVMSCVKKGTARRVPGGDTVKPLLSEILDIDRRVEEAVKDNSECVGGVGIKEMCSNGKLKNNEGGLHEKVINKITNLRLSEPTKEYVELFRRVCAVFNSQPQDSIATVPADQVTVVSGGKRKSRKNRRNRRSRRNKNKRSRKHR